MSELTPNLHFLDVLHEAHIKFDNSHCDLQVVEVYYEYKTHDTQ